MNKSRIKGIISILLISFINLIILALLNVSRDSLLILFPIMTMAVYMLIGLRRRKKRYNKLYKDCDPEMFLESTWEQFHITGRQNTARVMFKIDIAEALYSLGKFEKALEQLQNIEETESIKGSKMNEARYFHVYVQTLYALNENKKAEFMYEAQACTCYWQLKHLINMEKYLKGIYLYYKEDYINSREIFEGLIVKSNKFIELNSLYRLALIDEKENKTIESKEKYKKIAEEKNKLWIVDQAKEKI